MAAERALLLGAGALLLGSAAWLGLTGPPGARVPATGGAPAAVAARLAQAAAQPPRTMSDARTYVDACRAAGTDELPQLRALAAHEDPLVAGNAIAALGALRRVHDDPGLLHLLDDPRPRVRRELVLALAASGDSRAAAALETVLARDDPQDRLLAIDALGRLGAHAPLERLLRDPRTDPTTRAFARAALQPPQRPAILASQ